LYRNLFFYLFVWKWRTNISNHRHQQDFYFIKTSQGKHCNIRLKLILACVAFNYDKMHQNCFLLKDLGVQQENALFVTGPKFCGNLQGKGMLTHPRSTSFHNALQFPITYLGLAYSKQEIAMQCRKCMWKLDVETWL
jgi:hypothetical protein